MKNEVVPAVKTKSVSDDQKNKVAELVKNSTEFLTLYKGFPSNIQTAFKEHFAKIQKLEQQAKKINAAIGGSNESKESTASFSEKISKAKNRIKEILAEVEKIKAQLAA